MGKKVFFRKKDLIIVAVIFLAVFLADFFQENVLGSKAEIIYNGEVIETLTLNKDIAISYDVHPKIVLEVLNGQIRFLASDCPDKICVNTGFISYEGESAACLPNKFIVRVSSGAKNPVDAVSK